jgi:Tfp pilus assembly pilus retraction ATPase PilT
MKSKYKVLGLALGLVSSLYADRRSKDDFEITNDLSKLDNILIKINDSNDSNTELKTQIIRVVKESRKVENLETKPVKVDMVMKPSYPIFVQETEKGLSIDERIDCLGNVPTEERFRRNFK